MDEHRYRIGEKVVHIPEGVCIIEEISTVDYYGESKQYYKLIPLMGETNVLYVSIDGPMRYMRKLRSKYR